MHEGEILRQLMALKKITQEYMGELLGKRLGLKKPIARGTVNDWIKLEKLPPNRRAQIEGVLNVDFEAYHNNPTSPRIIGLIHGDAKKLASEVEIENKRLREENLKLIEENKKLTDALIACQEKLTSVLMKVSKMDKS